MSAEFETDIC